MLLETILPFLTASMLLTIMPGPDIIYVLVQSISNGKKQGYATAIGLVSGIIIHTTLIAFGISKIIQESEIAFTIIKVFGALYLLYLAYKVFRQAEFIPNVNQQVAKKELLSLFKQGFLMNVLNPKVTLFFLAFFPKFLNENSSVKIWQQVYSLGFLFMLQALIIFSLVTLFASKLAKFTKENITINRIMKYVQVVLFILLAIYILI